MMKNGSMPVSCAARLCGLARSRSCTSITSSVAGATPRQARRSTCCSLEKPRSSRTSRFTDWPARWFDDDDTISTSGGSPRASSASKSLPITQHRVAELVATTSCFS